MSIKKIIRTFLNRHDLDVFQVSALDLTTEIIRKRKLFNDLQIDLVLDVGANDGQFGVFLRKHVGYTGSLVSFEPLSTAYAVLESRAQGDSRWELRRTALGATEGKAIINVSDNTQSSSILGMLDRHKESAPDSRYVGSEAIDITTLDQAIHERDLKGRNVYLKIDTQGFEKSVLDGAVRSIQSIDTIEMEVSFVPLYQGQLLFSEMHAHMRSLGFVMTRIDPMFSDPGTGELLQADVVFRRSR